MRIFRVFTSEEEKQFRQWARKNYEPLSEINGWWHPVIQDECIKINQEYDKSFEEIPIDYF
jgi:alpha-ketoglutarate-dependent taurine dioxygenase